MGKSPTGLDRPTALAWLFGLKCFKFKTEVLFFFLVCDGSGPVSLSKRSQIGLFFVVVAGVLILLFHFRKIEEQRIESLSLCHHSFLRFYCS